MSIITVASSIIGIKTIKDKWWFWTITYAPIHERKEKEAVILAVS